MRGQYVFCMPESWTFYMYTLSKYNFQRISLLFPWNEYAYYFGRYPASIRSVRVAERLALPTSDHGVAGSNPAGGEILPEPKRRFIAQILSCSTFHRLEMTDILLKGRKTRTHPSIMPQLRMGVGCITFSGKGSRRGQYAFLLSKSRIVYMHAFSTLSFSASYFL